MCWWIVFEGHLRLRLGSTDAAEFARAYELLAEHRVTSGLGIPDCPIAAMSLIRKARLYTFNLKHFQVIPGIDVQEPYSRQ
jgi:predicted nucleic acid-binding protein